MRTRFLLLLLVLLSVTPLAAQTCNQVNVPYSGACGYVQKFSSVSPQFSIPTTSYSVKACKRNSQGQETGPCYFANTNSGGEFDFYSIGQPYDAFNVYIWNDSEYYGSSSVPVTAFTLPPGPPACSGPCGVYMGWNTAYPRPLLSPAVYPANHQTDTPLTFTLKWSDGSNAARSGLQIVYDLYAHGYGGADLLEASNLACNPDAQGNCTLAVTSGSVRSSEDWYWHVVGKIYYGNPINNYFTTTNSENEFTTLTDPNRLVAFLTADYSHYLAGAACGGSGLIATALGPGGCSNMKVIDLNGGDLMSGDQVNLQLGNWYVSAELGGNDAVNVNRTVASIWETFTIYKQSGSPGSRIMHGDRVAFLTYDGQHYIEAANYGGGATDAYATSPWGAATFVFLLQ